MEALQNEDIGQVAAGGQFTLALTHDHCRLYSFGRADYGQLGIGVITAFSDFRNTPQPVKFPKAVQILEINAGENHGMAITTDGQLYTWGFNEGSTGLVDVPDIVRPSILNFTPKCRVMGFSGGGYHSLMLVQSLENGLAGHVTPPSVDLATIEDDLTRNLYFVISAEDLSEDERLLNQEGNRRMARHEALFVFGDVGERWRCSTCFVRNPPTALQCLTCTAPRLAARHEAPFWFVFEYAGERWRCSTCRVLNPLFTVLCLACTAPRLDDNVA